MPGPLGLAGVLAVDFSPTRTDTPVNIASVIIVAIIIFSCDLYLPTDRRGHGFFVPLLAGGFE